jgi:hypothetical protein
MGLKRGKTPFSESEELLRIKGIRVSDLYSISLLIMDSGMKRR